MSSSMSWSAAVSKILAWKPAIALAFLSGGILLTAQAPATAQAAYGSYVGVGPSFGFSDGPMDDGDQFAAVIAGRYKFLELPLSARGQVYVSEDSVAFVPTVSYDFPLNWQTDVYIGAGVAFAGDGSPSPVGDKVSLALQPGIDYILPDSNLVLFGNAIFAFDAYRDSNATAIAVQGGVGVQF